MGMTLLVESHPACLEHVAGPAHPGRRILFLEGGYNTDAIADSSAACTRALAGTGTEGARTSGGPGMDVVEEVARLS